MTAKISIPRRRQGGLASCGALVAVAFMQMQPGQALETGQPRPAKGQWLYVDMPPGGAKLGWGDPAEDHFDGIRMECSTKRNAVLMVVDVDPKGAKRAKATVSRGGINLVVQGPVEEGPDSSSINGNISFSDFAAFGFQGGDIVINSAGSSVSYSAQNLENYLPKFIKTCGMTATPQLQQVAATAPAPSAGSKAVSNKSATTLEYMAIMGRIHPEVFTDKSIFRTLMRSVFCDEYSSARDEFERREKIQDLHGRIRAATANPPDTLTDINVAYELGEYDFNQGGFPIKAKAIKIRGIGAAKARCWPEQTPLFFVPESVWFVPYPNQLPTIVSFPKEAARELVRIGRLSYRASFDLQIMDVSINDGGIISTPFLGLKGKVLNWKAEIIRADGKVAMAPNPTAAPTQH